MLLSPGYHILSGIDVHWELTANSEMRSTQSHVLGSADEAYGVLS